MSDGRRCSWGVARWHVQVCDAAHDCCAAWADWRGSSTNQPRANGNHTRLGLGHVHHAPPPTCTVDSTCTHMPLPDCQTARLQTDTQPPPALLDAGEEKKDSGRQRNASACRRRVCIDPPRPRPPPPSCTLNANVIRPRLPVETRMPLVPCPSSRRRVIYSPSLSTSIQTPTTPARVLTWGTAFKLSPRSVSRPRRILETSGSAADAFPPNCPVCPHLLTPSDIHNGAGRSSHGMLTPPWRAHCLCAKLNHRRG